MKNKAIIFDIDGTAMPIGDNNWPSDRLRKAIANIKKKYFISTATGRSFYDMKEIIDFLDLTDGCILASGSEIYSPIHNRFDWQVLIPLHVYSHISRALEGCNNKIWSSEYSKRDQIASKPEKILDGRVSVIYVVELEVSEAVRLADLLKHPDIYCQIIHSYFDYSKRDIHICSAKASKKLALEELIRILNVNKEDTIVVGDGLNDLQLFEAGGTKVAMGNAVPELKATADIVIGDVADDGLAEYLERLALGV